MAPGRAPEPDAYFVRLRGAAAEPIPVPSPIRHRHGHRYRRIRVLAVLASLLGLVYLFAPDDVAHVLRRVVGVAEAPVKSLRGEADLRNATTVFEGIWSSQRSYLASPEQLAARGPDVDWSRVTVRPCLGGQGVVLVAHTLVGTTSRLLLEGNSAGDLEGDQPCPPSATDRGPWPR